MTEIDAVPEEVRQAYIDIAVMLRGKGYTRYSSDAILHRVRWHFQIEMSNRDFKCNNDWTAPLARWAMDREPNLKGFFETRVRKSVDPWE